MSKKKSSKTIRRRSTTFIILSWVASLLSVGLVLLAGRAVLSDLGAFRSCNSNSAGLVVRSCGKTSLNVGDFMLLVLLFLSVILAVTIVTGAWRSTKGVK